MTNREIRDEPEKESEAVAEFAAEGARQSLFPTSTCPHTVAISLQGFGSEERAKLFGYTVYEWLKEIGHELDLNTLDGVTVAADFASALSAIHRGISTDRPLSPTRTWAHGIAMTPTVLRDGVLKSHIAIDANVLIALEKLEGTEFGRALHTLWHECAHVEINSVFDKAFPTMLLRERFTDLVQSLKWKVIFPCWDEYAACRLTGTIGYDPTDDYESLLIKLVQETRLNANDAIRAYRLSGDHQSICEEIYAIYGTLLKAASYYLGVIDATAVGELRLAAFQTMKDHVWFAPFLGKLHKALQSIFNGYSRWSDRAFFDALGEVARELVEFGGVTVSSNPDGTAYVSVPFTSETLP